MTAHKNRPIFSPLYCTSIMCYGSTFVLTVYNSRVKSVMRAVNAMNVLEVRIL